MKRKLHSFCVILCCVFCIQKTYSQGFKADDYKKAAWMTARFYGAQRSGNGPNWILAEHTPTNVPNALNGNIAAHAQGKSFIKDADGTYDLTGGWVDCGDHVKFGQTEFYAAYMLILGYSEFPAGYNDYYSSDYKGYITSKDYSWEGAKDSPNGIPDILDELKYATDFFQKCMRSTTQFYYQVGDGDVDHKHFITSAVMSTLPNTEGGEANGPRSFKSATGNVTSMASLCGATLAAMARLYKKFDPVYAQACLDKALIAYTFVNTTTKGNTGGGGFYPAKTKYEPDMVIFFTELYRTTGDTKYLTAAVNAGAFMNSPGDWNHNYSLCYNNTEDLAYYLLGKCGDATTKARALYCLDYYVNTLYKPATGFFLNAKNDPWGILRYPANQAFVCALFDKLKGVTTINPYTAGTVDYIMGKNGKNFSYIVGFGANSPKYPHHRNYYGSDADNEGNLPLQTKYTQFGYMVGGSINDGAYTDNEKTYTFSEGGIDYNAGLVGAISYMVSMMAPVDTTRFGHPAPQLGDNQSMCGVTSILLDSKVPSDGKKTFTWLKDGKVVLPSSTTAKTYTATASGTYVCQIDSIGWSTNGTIIITGNLPDFSIGKDVLLCTKISDTLTAPIGTGFVYTWKKNGTVLSSAKANSFIAYSPGTYVCTINAIGCLSKSDTAIITSNLPTVISDTICASGIATLSVSSAGSYAWYDVPSNGIALGTGSNYSPSIVANKTYYVQDASSVTGSVGPTTRFTGGMNWGISLANHLKFTVGNTFNLNSLKVNVGNVNGTVANATLTIEILDAIGLAFTPAKLLTSNPTNVTPAMANSLIQFSFTNCVIDKSWGTNLQMRVSATTINGDVLFNPTGAVYPYNSTPSGIVTITGAAGGDGGAGNFMYFYDWSVSSGSTCSRAPVFAVIDPSICNADNVAPTTPGTVVPISQTATSVVVSWATSTDNVAVIAYELYMNGVLQSTVTTGTTTTITGLSPNIVYLFKVRAKDAVGNLSPFSAETPFSLGVTQTISLVAGWNIVSFNVHPTDSLIPSVFASLGNNLITIKTQDAFYDPSQLTSYNSLLKIEKGAAYLIKVTNPQLFTISGKPIGSIPVSLKTGWNLLGYPKTLNTAIPTVLSTMWQSFELIKNFDGFYLKAGTLNSLTNMIPGSGYFIKVSAPCNVSY